MRAKMKSLQNFKPPTMASLSFSLSLLILLITTAIFFIDQANAITHQSDIQHLKALKNGIRPESMTPGSCLSSWDFAVDPCDHVFTDMFTCGFRCDLVISGLKRVTEISLDQAGYEGSLSHTSWNFPYLETLDLSSNSLSGSLHHSLAKLTRLRRLSLSGNSFSGKIPPSLGSLSHLEELDLNNNQLIGEIPRSFNGLVNLKRLDLQFNRLSGDLPDLSRLRNLNSFDLSDNQISGELQGKLPTSLIEFSMRNNSLMGKFPEIISDLGFLQVMDLSHNALSGEIPATLFDHPSLQQITLSHNNFTAVQAPEDMGFQSRLIAVDLSNNGIHGMLPAFMASMPELSALSLENNKFTGMIPAKLALKVGENGSNTMAFSRLLLGGNYLYGPIPAQFMGLKPGYANVSLVDNCLYKCPDEFFFCSGGHQKSYFDCKSFRPVIPR